MKSKKKLLTFNKVYIPLPPNLGVLRLIVGQNEVKIFV